MRIDAIGGIALSRLRASGEMFKSKIRPDSSLASEAMQRH